MASRGLAIRNTIKINVFEFLQENVGLLRDARGKYIYV